MTPASRPPVVAIAHDYLTQRGGAERVILAMHRAYPEAKIYTTLYDPEGTFPEFRELDIVTSPLNRVGPLRRDHRVALPFLAFASSAMHIPADVVIASTTGWAHAFPTSGKRLVYCNTPARWVYLTNDYLGGPWWRSPTGWALAAMRPFLRAWDQRAAKRAGPYIGNSSEITARIKRVYDIDSVTVFPPHSVDTSGAQAPIAGLESFVGDGGHFLIVSRLMPYKNVDKAIEAFRGLEERLIVVGKGPMADELRAQAPENVRFAEMISDDEMRWLYANAKALIAPSFEDFGITPLEASAWGKPVLALRAGGYLDTVREGVNGSFFDAATAADIRGAVLGLSDDWDAEAIRAVAEQFSEERFARELRAAVEATLRGEPLPDPHPATGAAR